jgi:competence protein ComEC
VLLALAGAAWLLAPRGLPWRASGLAFMLPAFMLPAPAPATGEAWVTVLDVGQGLAVLVRTATHALLYDAGPAFGGEADSGSRVILPFLRAEGIARLDAVILTHADADHLGGARSVLEALEVDGLRSSLARDHPLLARRTNSLRCERGAAWQWDGVRFELLHPAVEDYARAVKGNDLSCVLRVSAGGRAMLLSGDIERSAEALLRERSAEALLGERSAEAPLGERSAAALRGERAVQSLRADVLLVPHHGSRTSSSAAFLDAVAPRRAVVSVGHRNRFRHPNGEVMERYRARGVRVERTDLDGALTLRLGAENFALEAERERAAHYWRDRRERLDL